MTFIAVASVLAALVADSVRNITSDADRIDDVRAVSAGASAVGALKKQMGGTVRDNAFWDEAYRKVQSPGRDAWIVDNWGSTTLEYPLYDTAIVVDPTGATVMAYESGEAIGGSVEQRFGESGAALVEAARATGEVPVHFLRSEQGIVLAGAATIRPVSADITFDNSSLHVLLFAKHLSAGLVATIASDFSLGGLVLDRQPNPSRLMTPLDDARGETVGYLTWPRQQPGSKSYVAARPQLFAAAIILIVYLTALGVVALLTIRNLRAGEIVSRYKATHDALSGLWNRAGLLENLGEQKANAAESGAVVQLCLIDLDGFKGVNDAWGHAVGDGLIAAVAGRLSVSMPQQAIVARLGGDEFSVVLAGSPEELARIDVPGAIQKCLCGKFRIGERSIEIGASVGMTTSAGGATEAHELLRQADIALYRAKDHGRGVSVTFDVRFDEELQRVTRLEGRLRQTLARNELGVAFQPLVYSNGRGICGVEALARWVLPNGDTIGPDVFVPLAERSGLIDVLGRQILEKATRQALQWPGLSLAVNVSPIQLRSPCFVHDVLEVLSAVSFPPTRLTLEITEGALISSPDQARRAISGLKAAGVKVALDDFGCGYASIGTLREFGFDRMKVDRSLIAALDTEANGGKVLQATVALANALDIPVTAEGIETHEQATLVRLSGCDELQGYLFSRPLSAEQISLRYFPDEPSGSASTSA